MENFFEKQENLFIALRKCEVALSQYRLGQKQDLDNWNKWHDLEYRIIARIKDLQSDYKHSLFETNGWVAI